MWNCTNKSIKKELVLRKKVENNLGSYCPFLPNEIIQITSLALLFSSGLRLFKKRFLISNTVVLKCILSYWTCA